MTLTPFLILILAAYALFIGALGWVSIWSKGAKRPVRSEETASAQFRARPAGRSAP